MSEQTWTDGQFAEFLAKMDSTPEEIGTVTITNRPHRFPWLDREILLSYQEQHILLSYVQSLAFGEWHNKKYPPVKSEQSKHGGDLGDGHVVTCHYINVEIRDRGAEFVSLNPKQALELLKWLYEHKDELEVLAKEQAHG